MEIEDCQRQFTNIVEGMGLLPYRQRLQRLRLTTLLERRMRGGLIETFKIINGFCGLWPNMFGTNTAYRTRTLNVTSHHPLRSAHDVFSNRVIKYWNQCPLRVRKIQLVSMPLRLVLTSFMLSKPD